VTATVVRHFRRHHQPDRTPAQAQPALTTREEQVLRLLARGMTNVEIAAELHVAPGTVKTHVATILAKLGARDRLQAVIIAYESGRVTP
jgi:DNA-binding NarL/FixJ family response regulator